MAGLSQLPHKGPGGSGPALTGQLGQRFGGIQIPHAFIACSTQWQQLNPVKSYFFSSHFFISLFMQSSSCFPSVAEHSFGYHFGAGSSCVP